MGNHSSANQSQTWDVSHSSQTRPKEVVGSGQGNEQTGDHDSSSNQSTVYPKDTNSTFGDTASILTHPEDTFPWPTIANGHFINTETLRAVPSSNQNGPRVRARNVFPQDEGNRSLSSDQLFKKWKSSNIQQQKNDVLLHILNIRIPYLESEKHYLETAVFLKINDESICKRVKESLMKCLLGCDDELDVSRILEAEVHVWRRLRQHEDHVFDLGLINLLLWCCLLCNTDITTETEERICELSKERRAAIQEFRHEVQSTASGDLFKALQSFHEEFPRRFAKRSVLSWGKDVRNTSNKMDEETLNLVKKAKFCDKLMHLFSLLKQILASGNDCEGILAYLKFILPSLLSGHTDEKETQTIAVLLTKGCVFALQTAFCQADVQVGQKEKPTKRELVHLIESVLDEQERKKSSIGSIFNFSKTGKKLSSYNRTQYIIDELSPLIFHPAESVSNRVYKLLTRFRQDFIGTLTQREIERGQSNCRLKIASHSNKNGNYFQTFKGEMGSQSVIIYANIPSFDNFTTISANNRHYSDETNSWDKERHINNFNMQRSIPSHINIGWLLGYQVKPFLMYYIIEDSHKTTLLEHVLEKRERTNWFKETDLCTILYDIVNGLSALHQHNIILRDLTLSNFFLDHGKVKIGDLSLACHYRTKNDMPVKDLYAWNLAVRWLSPEALKEGIFSPQSDIWSLGHLIYTLWTHGCEPYTEFPDSTTDDIMEKVAFGDVTPFQTPCMPQPIYNLMCRCLKKEPRDRIDLVEFTRELETYTDQLQEKDNYSDTQKVTFQEIKDRDKHDGAPNVHQKNRRNVPEKGIPQFIQDYRKASQESCEYSFPLKKKSVSQQHFLKGPFDLKLKYVDSTVMVREPMRKDFVTKILPQIEATGFKPLKMFPTELHTNGAYSYIQGTAYPESKTLLDIALDETLRYDGPGCYIHLCYQVAKILSYIHGKGWILRDLRAKNFLVNLRTLEVYLCRKGRMVQLPYTETGHEFVKDDKDALRESHRWLPAESVIDGIYSRSSDVAAWAFMTYEVLQALSECSPAKSVPYHTSSDEELGMLKQNGGNLPKPNLCPDWLYEILLKCWNPDRNKRSQLVTVIDELKKKLEKEILKHTNRMAASLDDDVCPKYEHHEASKQNKPLHRLKSLLKPKRNHNNQISRNTVRSTGNFTDIDHVYSNHGFYEEENPYTLVSRHEQWDIKERPKSSKSHKQRHVRRCSSCSSQFRTSLIRRSRQRKSAFPRKRRGIDIPLPDTPSGNRCHECNDANLVECQSMKSAVRCEENEADELIGGIETGENRVNMQKRDYIYENFERFDMMTLELHIDGEEDEEDRRGKSRGLAITNCTKPEQLLLGGIVSGSDDKQTRHGEQGEIENIVLTSGQTKEERGLYENFRDNRHKKSDLDKEGQIVMIVDEAHIASQRDIGTQELGSKEDATCENSETSGEEPRSHENSNHWPAGLQNKSKDIPVETGLELENQGENAMMIKDSDDQQETNIQYKESQQVTTDNTQMMLEEERSFPIKGTNPGKTARHLSKGSEDKRSACHGDIRNKREVRVQIGETESKKQMREKDEKTNVDDDMSLLQTSGTENRMFDNRNPGSELDREQYCHTETRKEDPKVKKKLIGHNSDTLQRRTSLSYNVLVNPKQGMQVHKKSDQKCQGPITWNTPKRSQSESGKRTTRTEIIRETRTGDMHREEHRQNDTTDKNPVLLGNGKLENRREDTKLNLVRERRARKSQDTDMKIDLPEQMTNVEGFENLRDKQKLDRRKQKSKTVREKQEGLQKDETTTTENRLSQLEQQGRTIDDCQRQEIVMEPEVEQGRTCGVDFGPLPPGRWVDFDVDPRTKGKYEKSREPIVDHGFPSLEPQKHQVSPEEGGGSSPHLDSSTSGDQQCNNKIVENSNCRKKTTEGRYNDGNVAIRSSIVNESCCSASSDVLSVNQIDWTDFKKALPPELHSTLRSGLVTRTESKHHADAKASSAIETILCSPKSVIPNHERETNFDSDSDSEDRSLGLT